MGYLSDNIPPGRNYAVCQDLYKFRLIVEPGFASDVKLAQMVLDVVPDVEEWQFSGRRRCPVPGSRGKSQPVNGRQIHPATWAQNSRRMRPFLEEVVFAFHTEDQRAAVAARFTNNGFKFRLEDEPTSSTSEPVIVVI